MSRASRPPARNIGSDSAYELDPAVGLAARAWLYKAKYEAAKTVLADREAELLRLKGPCRVAACRLHYAHSGPCDIQ